MANHRGGWVGFFRICFLVVVSACLSCDGGEPDLTVASRLTTTGRTAADEQARATASSATAARYRQLADENRQAVAALTQDTAARAKRQAAAALADRLAAAAQKAADFHAQRAAEMAATAAGTVRP